MPGPLARFRLNGQLVDPALNRVTIDDQVVQIEPKIMDVLVALAEHPGEVVTRSELMARVWPSVFVTDDVLNRAIRELRRVFSDKAEQPLFIDTIRKRGYRLLATVERDDGTMPPAKPSAVVIAVPASKMAPLANHSRAFGGLPIALVLFGVLTVVVVLLAGPARARLTHGLPDRSELLAHFAPFTSTPGNEVQPALSATGRLAFVARAADDRAHLFLKRLEDASATQVTDGLDREIEPA
jgi:DNA-binding winged helix-turn-helix (wHTH) protein